MPLIVILDDAATNRKIFQELAASIEAGAVVRSFGDPAKALAWLEHNTPDLIVTDFKMPKMDGAEFMRRFRRLPNCSEIPTIVITIYEEREFRMRALEAGATDFLNSPVDHHEFIIRARNLLKLRKQQLMLAARADHLAQELKVSERSRKEELRDSTERLAQVIDTVPAMVSATDRHGRILFINAFHAAIAGISSQEAVGRDVEEVCGASHGKRSKSLDRKVIARETALPSFEEEIVDFSGRKRIFLTTKIPLRDRSNVIVGVLTAALDITERKIAENHLFHMANHDALTGLANRPYLSDHIRLEIARTRRGDRSFALHIIDLDGFKKINDALGHSVGDMFLVEIANRLRKLARNSDMVARLGGDEFAILQTHVTRNTNVSDFAKRILEAVNAPWSYANKSVGCNASVGIAVHPTDGADVEDLLRNGDHAMYRAKQESGNGYRFYVSDMTKRAHSAWILDADLRSAIEEDQFVLHFQPQIALRTGQVVGAEALLRWQRPKYGLIGPKEFLAHAEENGSIVPLNDWVLHEACRAAKSWQMRGEPIRVSVNLSSIQFFKQNVPLLVTKVLGETGLDPWLLDLELTESIVMHDAEAVAKDLQQLRDMGVRISIDDFGTRYSTFTYVKHFPVDRLKIDQCFINDLPTNTNDAAIVRAIVSLGHSLDLEVVAEGVERAAQLSLLQAEGCDEVQGFYFSKPIPSDDLVTFMDKNRAQALCA